jgi:hypothetical protein
MYVHILSCYCPIEDIHIGAVSYILRTLNCLCFLSFKVFSESWSGYLDIWIGISIPCDYTSFIAPIATSKLWMCANETLSPLQPTAQQLLQTGNRGLVLCTHSSLSCHVRSTQLTHIPFEFLFAGLNTPYVVKFHNCYRFAKAKPLFRFVHPNPCAGVHAVDNTRYVVECCTVCIAVPMRFTLGPF